MAGLAGLAGAEGAEELRAGRVAFAERDLCAGRLAFEGAAEEIRARPELLGPAFAAAATSP